MIDLTPFCGTDPSRPYLCRPFSQGNFTYATNGHIAIRVPRLPEFEEQKMPDALSLFRKAEPKPEFLPLRLKLPVLQEEDCPNCDGTGKEHDCPDCECECVDCDGTGVAQVGMSVAIRGAVFNVRYIRLIQGLPNARLAVTPFPDDATWFEFDGGDGILMSVRQPFAEHIAEPEEEPVP